MDEPSFESSSVHDRDIIIQQIISSNSIIKKTEYLHKKGLKKN